MRKFYLLILMVSAASTSALCQQGAFQLKVDANSVTILKKINPGPGSSFDIVIDTIPAKFEMIVSAHAKNNKKDVKDSVVISTRKLNPVVTDHLNAEVSKKIFHFTPKDSVSKLVFKFKIDKKIILVNDNTKTPATEGREFVVEFGPASPVGTQSSALEADTNPCEIVDPNARYFIPTELMKYAIAEETCVECKNNYKVAYDLGGGEPTLCYYERVKCECDESKPRTEKNCSCPTGQKYCYVPVGKAIRPRVGDRIGYHIFGYYPSFDSLTIDFTFESRNQELKDQFSAAFSQSASDTSKKTEPKETPEEDAESTATATRELKKTLDFVNKLKNELKEYHDFLITSSPSQEQVSQDVEYINNKMNSYCIELPAFSPSALIAAVRQHIAAINENRPATREEIMAAAKIAAAYYGFILNYSTMKVPVVQVPNEDMLKYTMGFYKNGKKLHTGNYSLMIRGGWKIDFSTGIVFNNLTDKEYEIKYDTIDLNNGGGTRDAVGQIKDKDKGKINANIAIMSHIYPRTGTRVNFGGTFGFVFQTGSVLKYIGGLSLMLGHEQRFVVSWGAVGGVVDRLDSSYNDAYDKPVARSRFSSISSAVPTVKKWEFGQFLSFTYNLGGTTIGK